MPPIKHQRRIKLIKPKLQLRLVGKFFGLAVLGLLLQFLLLGRLLPSAVAEVIQICLPHTTGDDHALP